jgi:hypothetical protein
MLTGYGGRFNSQQQ